MATHKEFVAVCPLRRDIAGYTSVVATRRSAVSMDGSALTTINHIAVGKWWAQRRRTRRRGLLSISLALAALLVLVTAFFSILMHRGSGAAPTANVYSSDSSRAGVSALVYRRLGGGSNSRRGGLWSGLWRVCALEGGSCRCVGTLGFSSVFGSLVREINADGETLCTADALRAPSHIGPRMCWCLDGVPWGEEVRKGLAAMVRQGLTPRVEVASEEVPEPGCDASSDGTWYGCVILSRRWDATPVAQAAVRAVPPEEQLDMALRRLDACQHMTPRASLRVLGVRGGQAADIVEMPVSLASVCSVVYKPGEGALWTAETSAVHCATQPGHCTATPCDCRRADDRKLELRTPEGRLCWACTAPGEEYKFRVTALAERVEGHTMSWWPPSGINCPPLLWIFMDWRAVLEETPVMCMYMILLIACLLLRKLEEWTQGLIPWTRTAPLFGPALKRGEVWRFFSFTFVHVQFLDLFHNLLTLLDALDVEGTPAILLGDGSNLKCGVGVRENFMCYPSIGIGSVHTLGVALLSAAVGGMCSTWVGFQNVFTGASALGFGLSGAIVALYALYAGAELDQSISLQRSFQDWVWLRLIFVGFHVGMEFIRGVSQKDAGGLLSHTAAFLSGFGYVLYFLPPMGDDTLLPSDRPYVVPCAYSSDTYSAEAAAPQCVRLFSQTYEYHVSDLQAQLSLAMVMALGLTLANIMVLQRDTPSTQTALLAGLEVGAVCFPRKAEATGRQQQADRQPSDLDGAEIFLWCILGTLSNLHAVPRDGIAWRPVVEIRFLGRKPERKDDALLSEPAEASVHTRPLDVAGEVLEFHESLFLPVKVSKASHIQIVLRDHSAADAPLGVASIALQHVLSPSKQGNMEHRLRFRAIGPGGRVGVGSAIAHAVFRCLQADELQQIKLRVASELSDRRFQLRFREQELATLQAVAAIAPAVGSEDGEENSTQPQA